MRTVVLVIAVAACGCGSSSGHGDDSVGDDAGSAANDGRAPDAEPGPTETIHYIGRFDLTNPDAPVFEWSGSAIWTRFSGTGISAELDGSSNDFDVVVDGVEQPEIVDPGGDHTYQLASGLADGEHDLKLTRRTEAFFSTMQFKGFSGATLVATPRPTRLVEMVGDSITCGYGVTGAGPNCGFTHDTEAETHAWGALAADTLGVTHTAICWSGEGVYRNNGDGAGPLMPVYYERITPNENADPWNFSTTPQVVVVNLGTNDFSGDVDPGQGYVNAMIAFVAQIRGHYPEAWIVLATSPMLGGDQHASEKQYITTAAASDPHTVVLDLDVQDDNDGYGCDYHPDDITQQKMATKLVAELHQLEGW